MPFSIHCVYKLPPRYYSQGLAKFIKLDKQDVHHQCHTVCSLNNGWQDNLPCQGSYLSSYRSLLRGTRYFVMKIADKFKHFYDEPYDIFGCVIACEQQIKSGAASHRSGNRSFYPYKEDDFLKMWHQDARSCVLLRYS